MNASVALRTGRAMPRIGLGCWKIPKEATAQCVYDAIACGYRCLDGACDYGNEVEVGAGVKRAIDMGLCARADLFIVSKLWNTYHAAEHVPLALERTLTDMGLDYLDLYLVHFPIALKFVPFETRYPPEWKHSDAEPHMVYAKVPVQETWTAMEALVGSGKARDIGVCNFSCSGLRDLLSYATIPPAVLQVELHPYNTQDHLIRYCASEGIQVVGFSPLGSPGYVQIGMAAESDACWDEAVVKAAAAAHGKTPAQVLLRWGLQHHGAVVPKSVKPERQHENVSIYDFELTAEEMGAITALNKDRRFNDPAEFTQGMNSFCPIYH